MDEKLLGILNGFVVIFILIGVPLIIGTLAEKRRERLDRRHVFKAAVLNRRTGHVAYGIVDLGMTELLQLEELTIAFEHIPGPHDTAIARFRDAQGDEQSFGLTMEQNTYDHGLYRLTFMRCNGDLELAKRELEEDYFGLDEGDDIDLLTPDRAKQVADSPAWCFVFVTRKGLNHVVLPPKTWRRLRHAFDEEKMAQLPTARQVFYACGQGYDEAADTPVDSAYRTLPTKQEVQEFADRIGKTIALYIADGGAYCRTSIRRAFLVQPRA